MDEHTNAPTKPPKLLDQLRDAIRRRHYSDRTEQSYAHWIKRFIFFTGRRHPREMGAAEVTDFLSHLARDRDVAAATQNQALAAILFLYKEVLAQPLPWLDQIERAKRPARMPTVLSVTEIQRLKLRVKDIDFDYRQTMVRDANGGKDRATMLPGSVIEPLQQHLVRVRSLHERDLASGHGVASPLDALQAR